MFRRDRGRGPMFLRVVRATVSKGVKREYVRLVEAYRDRAGKTQHRTILNLGRKDLLAAHLDLTKLRRLLHGEEKTDCEYVIQTEEPNLSAVEAVRLYKELSEVERAFANLKDVIDLRPIYHRTDDRVQAHIFVAALAFLLHRAVEKKLKAAALDLSATQALTALKSVRLVEIDLGNGTTKRSVTRGTQRAASVLRALEISELDPPAPPQPGQTIM
jgi:Transposase DDE domain